MVIDRDANLLISDSSAPGSFIRRVDAATGTITTVVGDGVASIITPGPALDVGFPGLSRLALAPNGDLYAAYYGAMLLRISAGPDGLVNGGPGEEVSVVNSCALTSCPALKFRGDTGPVSLAEFRNIYAVAVEPNGDVLIGDSGDARIRRISAGADHLVTGAADETIVTVAGHNPGDANGFNMVNWRQAEDYGLSAWVGTSMWEILIDPRGGFFFSNGNEDLVRRIGGSPAVGSTANLSISPRVSPEAGMVGSTLTYRVTVKNAGPAPAHAVTLTMPAIPGATIIGASPAQGSCTAPPSGPVTCDLGPIPSGAESVVTITARADVLGTLTATFEVTAQETDPLPANNTATLAVEIEPAADLAVVVLTPLPGATLNAALPLTYDVVMSNLGPNAAFTSRLRYEVPAELSFVSATMPGGLCTFEFGAVVCDLDGLQSGASVHATIVVRTTSPATFTSTFNASAPLVDPNGTNNTVAVTTTLEMVPAVINIVERVIVADDVLVSPARMISVGETILVHDEAPVVPARMISVGETILVHDQAPVVPARMITVAETVFVNDETPVSPARMIAVSERIVISDSQQTTAQPFAVPVPIGTGVFIPLISPAGAPVPVTLTFAGVTQPGVATGTPLGTFPPLPFDFLLKSTVYDVVTTAQYTPPVTVCFTGAFAPTDRLYHHEGGAWRDVTTLLTPTQICGTVTSLSPFVVAEPPNHAPTADAGGNQAVEATSAAGATVTLVGTGADSDPGDVLTFMWSEGATTLAATAAVTLTLAPGEHALAFTVTDLRGASAVALVQVSVRDTTPPVLTLPGNITVSATSAGGAAVSFVATATNLVDGSVAVTCSPQSGSTFAVGTTTVSCSAADAHANQSTGSFTVTVQPGGGPGPISLARFVALGIDQVWLRAGSRALTGDVGANRAMPGIHLPWNPDDAADPDLQIEVIVGLNAGVLQPGSRVIGDTVWLCAGASVFDVIENELIRSRFAKVAGEVSTPATLPLVELPILPAVSVGTTDVVVRADRTVTLPPGRYRRIQVQRRGTLILSGGVYEVQSIDLDWLATILARGVTELRVKSELAGDSSVRLLADSSQPGLTASSFTIFIEGSDVVCTHDGFGPDGDNAGATAVHIGADSQVQANIYAPHGTVWLKARTKATGAFIGQRVRIGEGATLRLDSAFK